MELGIDGLDRAAKIETWESSVLYRARQIDLDRDVAVKVLSDTDESFVRQFSREAKALGKLGQHQHVVTVYDTGVTADGHPYLIVELCQSSVADQLSTGSLEPEAAFVAAAQIADALAEAHDAGIPHGAIRPSNILIGQTGRYVVADFGLGPAAKGGPTSATARIDPYRAPEAGPGDEATAAGDVYSLGATLFHMVAGHPPATGAPNLRELALPDDGPELIEAALAIDPSDRPTAAALRDRLLLLCSERVGSTSAIGGFDPVVGFGGPAVATAATTVTERPVIDTAPPLPPGAPAAPPPPGRQHGRSEPPATIIESDRGPAMTKGAGWLAPPAGEVDLGNGGNGESGRGVLEAGPSNVGIQLGEKRELSTRFEDGPSRTVIAALSVVGLLLLLGAGAFVVLQSGGDDTATDDGVNLETVDGPETSLDQNQNEAGGQTADGAVGSLSAGADNGRGTESTGGRFASSTTERPSTTARPATVPSVAVPSLIGSGAVAAERQLEQLGFVVARLTEPSTAAAPGQVIRLNPQAGALVRRGGTVTMIVATAPPIPTATIPTSVIGATEAEARASLTALGFTSIGEPVTKTDKTVPAGVVIGVTPAAGTEISVDDPVTLLVSSGPPVAPDCTAVVGLTEGVATSQFEAAGVTVTAAAADHATSPVGTVTACSASGLTASLLVSQGPILNLCSQAVGQPFATTNSSLTAAGYTVSGTPVTSTTVPDGQITDCAAAAASVSLTYAQAPAAPTCPPVAGQTVAAATPALTAAGFTEIATVGQPSDTVAVGAIISCTAAETVATLAVSTGPEATDVVVPDLSGQTQQAATANLTALGLTVTSSTVASTEPAGTVVGSTPGAGATVPIGSAVVLQISEGPAPVAVPDVVGRRQGRATTIVEEAGFTVAIQREFTLDLTELDRVLRMSPGAGTELAPGAPVVLTIGSLSN